MRMNKMQARLIDYGCVVSGGKYANTYVYIPETKK